MASEEVNKQNDVVAIELPAPSGWIKKVLLFFSPPLAQFYLLFAIFPEFVVCLFMPSFLSSILFILKFLEL